MYRGAQDIALLRHRAISHCKLLAWSTAYLRNWFTFDNFRGALIQWVFCIIWTSNDPAPNLVLSRTFNLAGSMFLPGITHDWGSMGLLTTARNHPVSHRKWSVQGSTDHQHEADLTHSSSARIVILEAVLVWRVPLVEPGPSLKVMKRPHH